VHPFHEASILQYHVGYDPLVKRFGSDPPVKGVNPYREVPRRVVETDDRYGSLVLAEETTRTPLVTT
jgi:hypothetical protein